MRQLIVRAERIVDQFRATLRHTRQSHNRHFMVLRAATNPIDIAFLRVKKVMTHTNEYGCDPQRPLRGGSNPSLG